MRIASSMIYEAGVASMQKQTSALMHTQQQLSSGRRILAPSDDPVAAARALEVEQARDTNAIYLTNQKTASESLALVEGNLVSVRAELKQEKEEKKGEKVVYSERAYGMASRSFTLPAEVDAKDAKAEYKDGLLSLTLPKKANGGGQRVAIS